MDDSKTTARWVSAWSTSPIDASLSESGVLDRLGVAVTDVSARTAVLLTAGGTHVRLTLSNIFGVLPLHVAACTIAIGADDARGIDPATLRTVTFGRQTHKRLLSLGAVALGVDTDVHVLIAAAVDGIIGQVLDRVERLAAAANDRAHVAAGQVHVHAAIFTRGDLDLRLDAHVLEQAADKCADARIALRLVRCRCGSGRCGRRLLLCGRSRSRSFRNGLGLLIRRLILHADDRGAGADRSTGRTG